MGWVTIVNDIAKLCYSMYDDCLVMIAKLLSVLGVSGIVQRSATAPAATPAASVKSFELLQKVSDDILRRELNAASNETASSKVVSWTSEGLQKSALSAVKSVEAVSTPASSECHSSKNLTVLDGDLGSLWSANCLSEMSVDSEMLRVSEPRSISSRDLHDTASAVDASNVSRDENVASPSVVEAPSKGELRKTPSDKIDDEGKITHEVEASETKSTDDQSKPSYARQNEDVVECQDNPADLASLVQIARDYPLLEETGSKQREISVEALSDGDRAITPDAGLAEDVESPSQADIVAKDVVHDLGMEANKTVEELSPEVPTAEVEVSEDIADDIGKETIAVNVPDLTAYKEAWPDMSSDSLEDLPTSQAPVDEIDILPLNELPSAVHEALLVETKLTAIQKEENLDFVLAEQDQESQGEWPPPPSDEELNVSAGEIELFGDDYLEFCDAEDTGLYIPLPEHDASAGTESGMLTKVGGSEKVLSQADHLRNIDSMHRFK